MKKRTILLSAVLVLAMLCCSACGSSSSKLTNGNPFEGQWIGKLDLTKQFEDGVKSNYKDLADYVDFENLIFVMNVTFDDGNMSMEVEQESIDTFMLNFEVGMQKLGKDSLEAYLTTQDMTLEEVVAESGQTEEEYMDSIFEQMGINKMTASMKEVINSSLDGLSKLKGAYTFDEEYVKLHYEDNTFEPIAYAFEGDELILTIKGDGFSLHIVCEK